MAAGSSAAAGEDWDAQLAAAVAHERQAQVQAQAEGRLQEGEDVTEEGWLPK